MISEIASARCPCWPNRVWGTSTTRAQDDRPRVCVGRRENRLVRQHREQHPVCVHERVV